MTEADWNSCTDPQAMLEFLWTRGKLSERKARLFAVACCRCIWALLTDERSQKAVEVLEQYTEGITTIEGLTAAARAAQLVAEDQQSTDNLCAAAAAANAVGSDLAHEYRGRRYEDEDEEVPCNPVSSAKDAAFAAAWAVGHAAHPEDSGDEWCAASKSQESMHCQLLRCILGNPFRPLDDLASSLLTPTVIGLARTIYEQRSFEHMRELADAVEAAGCTNSHILGHLRGTGPHVRGCWVLDLLLNKA
jgi:hypothetical protein